MRSLCIAQPAKASYEDLPGPERHDCVSRGLEPIGTGAFVGLEGELAGEERVPTARPVELRREAL